MRVSIKGDEVTTIKNKYGAEVHLCKRGDVYWVTLEMPKSQLEMGTISFGTLTKLNTYLHGIGFDDTVRGPFDLVAFLKSTLTPCEIDGNRSVSLLAFSVVDSCWLDFHVQSYDLGVPTFTGISKVVLESLNEEQITVEELHEAYKQLGWM